MKDIRVYISKIISDVAAKGDTAVSYYTARWDKVRLAPVKFRIPKSEIAASGRKLDPELRKSIEQAAANIRKFHKKELSMMRRSWTADFGGIKAGQFFNPVEIAGIYVPGGRFPYPSTVLMSAIPARTAGVKRVVIATPPNNAKPAVLYAAKCAGINEIYAVNGPAAIAAMALGTRSIPKVDIIAGPGNAFVNEAKRQVIGKVGIDSLAGPSEVAIIADNSADAGFIAADIFAQLEHDPDARAFLFAASAKLMNKVAGLLKLQSGYNLKKQYKAVVCSPYKAVAEVNKLAPEHLELAVKNPAALARRITSAGAVFAGVYTPTAVGDYWAGPSHVLPTSGAARFSGGLSAVTFIKKTSYIECPPSALKKYGRSIEKLASSEGLYNHKLSVSVRTRKGN